MRRSNQSVFNEYLPLGTNSSNPAYTSIELSSKLGHYDQLAIQVVIDNVSGTTIGAFDLYIEHSADGRNFVTTKGSRRPSATATSSSTLL
jgi:hypothetical protein